MGWMSGNIDLTRLFPMQDEASAKLMIIKAECLYLASVISETEKLFVLEQARDIIGRSKRSAAA